MHNSQHTPTKKHNTLKDHTVIVEFYPYPKYRYFIDFFRKLFYNINIEASASQIFESENRNMDCIFCKIINGDIPSNKVYEDEQILAFHDIAPQAPVHVIVIPKKHIQSADEINSENSEIVAKIFEAIPSVAKKCGLENGYRIITNIGEDGCQSVKHMHFHILGGKKLAESLG